MEFALGAGRAARRKALSQSERGQWPGIFVQENILRGESGDWPERPLQRKTFSWNKNGSGQRGLCADLHV